eukprot:29282-Pelagococcus_subviridis.AAC.6
MTSSKRRSIPMRIVTVDDGHDPHAPFSLRRTTRPSISTSSTSPPSAMRYGRTSSRTFSTFSAVSSSFSVVDDVEEGLSVACLGAKRGRGPDAGTRAGANRGPGAAEAASAADVEPRCAAVAVATRANAVAMTFGGSRRGRAARARGSARVEGARARVVASRARAKGTWPHVSRDPSNHAFASR